MDWKQIIGGVVIGALMGIAGTFFLFQGRISKLEALLSKTDQATESNALQKQPVTTPGTAPATTGIVINQPGNGDVVGGDAEVSGSYDPSVTDDIWVILWPEKAPGRGWPQTDDGLQGLPCSKRDGKWAVHCYFGGPPQSYRIVVYTATQSANEIISNTLKGWHRENDYVGIPRTNLPPGLKDRMEIMVRKGV